MAEDEVVSTRSRRRRGEYAELEFMARATSLGFAVSKPHGDSLAYDVIVDTGRELVRVQVRSATIPHARWYRVLSTHGRRIYRAAEIDVLAALVVPENAWYIIPVKALGRQRILSLRPGAVLGGKFEEYREAWENLGGRRRIFAMAESSQPSAPWVVNLPLGLFNAEDAEETQGPSARAYGARSG